MPKLLLHHEQRGNRYHSQWGHFLFIQDSLESKIKVYNPSIFDGIYPFGMQQKEPDEKKIIEQSVGFDQVTEHTRLIVIQQIAYSIGMSNVLSRYIPAKVVSEQATGDDSGYLDHRTGNIMITPDSNLIKYGDYYNILLTLYHERFHYEYHYRKRYFAKDIPEMEYETYRYIYTHRLFFETTFAYQGMVLKEMRDIAKEIGILPEF